MSEQVENMNNIEEFTAMANALSDITHSNINNQSSVSYIMRRSRGVANECSYITTMECKIMTEMSL